MSMKKIWDKADNTDRGEKVEIRRKLLSSLAAPSVLECFAGDGKMYASLYRGLPYLGLDIKPIDDGRPLICMDNRKFLRSADLSAFNFFDLDAYGSPWHQFLIVLHRRKLTPGEKIAVAITDGLDFKMRMSSLPDGLRPSLSIPPGMDIPCLNKHQEFISRRVVTLAAEQAGLEIEGAWIGQNPRGNMRYYGVIFKKV